MHVDRRQLGPRFRDRLVGLIARSGLTRTAFAAAIGVDRSALSQLLSGRDARLPRAETLAAIAMTQGVSLDWLLGLSESDDLATQIAPMLAIEEKAGARDDSRLLQWRLEAAGAKIRYVPANLPDLLMLPEITEVDLARDRRAAEARIAQGAEALAFTRRPETDMEVCLPRQRLTAFAAGAGQWAALPAAVRARQLAHMARLLDELYPTLRLFLYDEGDAFSAPYTIFGLKRAALYVGDMYLVLNNAEHIRALAAHFDRLIRLAAVGPHEAAAAVAGMAAPEG